MKHQILRTGDRFTDRKGERWVLRRVHRTSVGAELCDPEPTGLIWNFSRREVAGWTRITPKEEAA